MDLYFELKNTYIFYHFLNFEGNLKFYNSQLNVFPFILIAKNPWKGRLRFFLTLKEHSEFSGDGETADGLGFFRHKISSESFVIVLLKQGECFFSSLLVSMYIFLFYTVPLINLTSSDDDMIP